MVIRRKRGLSAARLKVTSHRMRSATVGTHVPRRTRGHMNGESVGFSSARKQKRATRGYVDTILPSTSTRESSSDYARRVSRREFTQEIQRKARVRRIVVVLACCLVALAVAVGVGVMAFIGSLDAKIALVNSDAASALVAAKEGKAFYTVVAADLDEAGSPHGVEGPDMVALVRVDPTTRQVCAVSIPPNVQVQLSDGKSHQLREAAVREGDAAFIRSVADYAGVDVAHVVKTDAASIVSLVDALGGVDVDVVEEVDDPTAGDVYLPAGRQTLDGHAALTLLRASNLSGGVEAQSKNQRGVLAAVASGVVSDGTFGFLSLLDKVGGLFKTDLTTSGALQMADTLRGVKGDAVFGAVVPGYETEKDGVEYYASLTDEWTAMMQRVGAGENPVVETPAPQVDPSSFTLTVRNGTTLAGAATQLTESLKERGYKVEETGNTDAQVYSETLVIYHDKKYQPAAQSVVETLGMGRTVASNGYYTFETDVLVVLGGDWKPAS